MRGSPLKLSMARRGPFAQAFGYISARGIRVGQTSVAKYMVRRRGPPSQGWKTFLRKYADGIGAMDLFVIRSVYGLLIMGHGRRQIRVVWSNRASDGRMVRLKLAAGSKSFVI